LLGETDRVVDGVTKGLAEPYADTTLSFALPVDMAAD
jgi:hypothetical protein